MLFPPAPKRPAFGRARVSTGGGRAFNCCRMSLERGSSGRAPPGGRLDSGSQSRGWILHLEQEQANHHVTRNSNWGQGIPRIAIRIEWESRRRQGIRSISISRISISLLLALLLPIIKSHQGSSSDNQAASQLLFSAQFFAGSSLNSIPRAFGSRERPRFGARLANQM